jgi:hypothetical protein
MVKRGRVVREIEIVQALRAVAEVIGILLAGAALAWAIPALAHDTEILQCDRNLKVESVKKLDERINPNGTVSEAYDRNGDGNIDIEAVSHIIASRQDGGAVVYDHVPHPFLYIVDLDYDGVPDAVYVDKSGEGRCDDIVLYLDLTKPHQDSADERRSGKI